MKIGRKHIQRTLKGLGILAAVVLLGLGNRVEAKAEDVVQDSGCNYNNISYTFTGDTSEPYGVVANAESYQSGAVVDEELTIPEEIEYTPASGAAIKIKVRGILKGAFKGRTSLKKLHLPSSLTYIGQEAFMGCTSLSEITTAEANFPGAITAEDIEYRAFYGCTQLKAITLAGKTTGGVKRVQSEAFMECTALTTLDIQGSVEWIDSGAFASCSSLDGNGGSVKVTDNPNFFIQNGMIYYRENEASVMLLFCPANTNIGDLTQDKFPANVTQIRKQAFYGCKLLSSIVLPSTVSSIGDQAFYDCSELKSVTATGPISTMGYQVFTNCNPDLVINCQSGSVIDNYALANSIKRSATCTVTFTNTFTGETQVQIVKNGETVSPPTGWERAGYNLSWTNGFTENTVINSSMNVATVWKKLFTVTFKDTASNLETVLNYIEAGSNVTPPVWTKDGYELAWDSQAYKNVNSDLVINAVWLVSLTDEENQLSDKQYKKGDEVVVGNLRYYISSYANKKVKVLGLVDKTVTSVTIPAKVTFGGRSYKVVSITQKAFRNNKKITKVTIGKNLITINKYAFQNCTKLKKMVIKSKVLDTVGISALKGTSSKLKVYTPTKSLAKTYKEMFLDAGMSLKATVAKQS